MPNFEKAVNGTLRWKKPYHGSKGISISPPLYFLSDTEECHCRRLSDKEGLQAASQAPEADSLNSVPCVILRTADRNRGIEGAVGFFSLKKVDFPVPYQRGS
ncbi:hypothetical cytosolic protein [Syntrophus aciditrophicus SB]|uniref:Hypothetical cytosolic protein n=1 Tax=Syntrophus aciditrophicus (strain SB) TaxID=56780 RepID=Q2LRF7_SYNAS|nr:hypothetical cytosolic protein [Syntrophus aciditrophicus SB]